MRVYCREKERERNKTDTVPLLLSLQPSTPLLTDAEEGTGQKLCHG